MLSHLSAIDGSVKSRTHGQPVVFCNMESGTARAVALIELSGLDRRVQHVTAVADLALSIEVELPAHERDTLVAAAWLHDVGYGERLAVTGFHPLDGARWLESRGERRFARLVANHTGAAHEARFRGLGDELAKFEPEVSLVADLVTWCDLHVGPAGERVTLDERIAGVVQRYGPDHVVSRSVLAGESEFRAVCDRVEAAMLS